MRFIKDLGRWFTKLRKLLNLQKILDEDFFSSASDIGKSKFILLSYSETDSEIDKDVVECKSY